ncbi:MAG: hypothetical protein NVSMB57_05810 [Actinomycetota bacterium]
MKHVVRVLLVCLVLSMTAGAAVHGFPSRQAGQRVGQRAGVFPDVPSGYWDASAIRTVAISHAWLPAIDGRFKPHDPMTRAALVRAVVAAFGHELPAHPVRPALRVDDVPSDDPLYRYVSIAVELHWMGLDENGAFLPDEPVTKADFTQVVTKALGLQRELAGLDAARTEDGKPLAHPKTFPSLALSGALRLFARHYADAPSPRPADVINRDDAAYALARAAASKGTWRLRALSKFRTFVLPVMSPERRAAVEFSFSYVGYPYISAGQWYAPARRQGDGCCGAQRHGGFDCSGFVWWVIKAPTAGYDNTALRKYKGWSLPERSSREMARAAPERVAPENAEPGDLLFSDIGNRNDDWRSIDHVGLALGNGWMIHSSVPGVLIEWVGDGWWPPHFRWARRLGQTGPPAGPAPANESARL